MRAPIVIAASIAGLVAGTAAVRAADLAVERSGYGCCYREYGSAPLVIWDNEPGVTMRRWWLPPWRNRHYYPHGRWAKKAASRGAGRRHVASRQSRRVPSYARYWTNPPSYSPETTPLIGDDTPLPRENPYRYMPSVVVVPTVR